jgi:pSer/pThr/pTyr-binding forkhead associated (FHA) protein
MTSILMLSVHLSGQALGTRAFSDGPIVIGRDPYAHIYLEDPHVSRRHATIERVGEAFLLTGVGANGTSINGTRIGERTELADGDRIEVSRFVIDVEIQAEEASSQIPDATTEFDDDRTLRSA